MSSTRALEVRLPSMPGPATNQRHAQRRFVGQALGEEAVVAQHFAVVGGVDDVGVVAHAACFEGLEDAADLVVDEGGGGAVLAVAGGYFFRCQVDGAIFHPGGFAAQVAGDGRRHVGLAVARSVFGWRVEWIVRPDKADEEVPGVVVGDALYPLGSATADVGVCKVFGGQDRIARVAAPAGARTGAVILVERLQQALFF